MQLSQTQLETKIRQITAQYVNIIYTLAEANHHTLIESKSQFLNGLYSKIRFSSYQKSSALKKVKIEPIYELSIDTHYEQSDSKADSYSNQSMGDLGSEAGSYSNQALVGEDSDDSDDFQLNNSSIDEGSDPCKDQEESLSDPDSDQKPEFNVKKQHQKNQTGKNSQHIQNKKYTRRTLSQKEEILDYALQHGRDAAQKKYQITQKYFRYCLCQFKSFKKYTSLERYYPLKQKDKVLLQWLDDKIQRRQKVCRDQIADKFVQTYGLRHKEHQKRFYAVENFFFRNPHARHKLKSQSLYVIKKSKMKIKENPYINE